MNSIWKFPFDVTDEFTLQMPALSKVLCVQVQGGAPCIWALVATTNPVVPRKFAVRGTGHNADGVRGSEYVGTFQLHGGALVFHLFDLGTK